MVPLLSRSNLGIFVVLVSSLASCSGIAQNAKLAVEDEAVRLVPNDTRADSDEGLNEAPLSQKNKLVLGQQSSVRLPTYKASDISAADRLEGTLGRVGDCLVVTIGASTNGFIPLFPEGRVRWDSDRNSLILNGRSYKIGDSVDFGGGSLGRDAKTIEITGEIPLECPKMNYWMVPLNG